MNHKYIAILSLVILLTSCQDVIELELSNTQIKPVIVAEVNDDINTVNVSVTSSSEFYNLDSPTTINNATIRLSDSEGEAYDFVSQGNGIYLAENFQGIRDRTYMLGIEIDELTYEASASIPNQKIMIDSIVVYFEEESIFRDAGFYPTIYFTDPPEEGNYYRINASVNGSPFDYNRDDPELDEDLDTSIKLYTDKFSNDGLQDFELFYNLEVGDVLFVEIQHLDKSTFDYLRTLVDVGGGSGVAPADPISNFGTDALGYFGAYTTSDFTITVQ